MDWCKYGFHSYKKVYTLYACNYVEERLKQYRYKVTASMIDDVYFEIYFLSGREFHDKVCMCCGKCFLTIEKEKGKINNAIKKHFQNLDLLEERIQLAKKIFDSRCGEGK